MRVHLLWSRPRVGLAELAGGGTERGTGGPRVVLRIGSSDARRTQADNEGVRVERKIGRLRSSGRESCELAQAGEIRDWMQKADNEGGRA
ncbi:unnamed protein product [Linum trigynum]|uniref:Uncharacterized protein n=1 Tax=Linum trigynum TaxID=586398 RepID=A0AAV2DE46_9ROSI